MQLSLRSSFPWGRPGRPSPSRPGRLRAQGADRPPSPRPLSRKSRSSPGCRARPCGGSRPRPPQIWLPRPSPRPGSEGFPSGTTGGWSRRWMEARELILPLRPPRWGLAKGWACWPLDPKPLCSTCRPARRCGASSSAGPEGALGGRRPVARAGPGALRSLAASAGRPVLPAAASAKRDDLNPGGALFQVAVLAKRLHVKVRRPGDLQGYGPDQERARRRRRTAPKGTASPGRQSMASTIQKDELAPKLAHPGLGQRATSPPCVLAQERLRLSASPDCRRDGRPERPRRRRLGQGAEGGP